MSEPMEDNKDKMQKEASSDISRRQFITMAAVAGVVAKTDPASASMSVTETDVAIKTSDGAVIVWSDAFGLRPAMRDIGKRIAAEGYSVLVPNPFYRVKPGPAVDNISSFNFQTDMSKIQPLMASINAPGNCEKDAAVFVGWLGQQKQVNTSKKIGTQGYCMGGPLVLKTCATSPDRMGAGGSFHGGGLVTDKADSPHLLATKIKARMYFGIASNDDMRQPDAKDKLRAAFAAARVAAEIEVYSDALHGWCVPDMPLQNGQPIYNKSDAERAWGKL